MNNAYDNKSSLRIDRSLIEEVQVISGTFDAEYGQAMSGVVNAVLRRGTDQFRWDAEVLTGGYVYAGGKRSVRRTTSTRSVRSARAALQASASGPLGLPKTYYLVSARSYAGDDYLSAVRRFRATDRSDLAAGIYDPTGDGETEPLGYSREWSGVAKLTNRSLPDVELNYQAHLQRGRAAGTPTGPSASNPDGHEPGSARFSIVHGLDLTHTLSKTHVLQRQPAAELRSTTRTWPTTTSTTRATTRPGRPPGTPRYELRRLRAGRGLHALPADAPARWCGRARSSAR